MAPPDPIDSPVPEPWDSAELLPSTGETSVAGSATRWYMSTAARGSA